MRVSRIIVALIFVSMTFGIYFLLNIGDNESNGNELPCMDIEWAHPNGVYKAIRLDSSNIASDGVSVENKLQNVLKLSENFIRMPYSKLKPEEVTMAISKYDENVVFLCLGLIKYGASGEQVGNFICDALEQLRCIQAFFDKQRISIRDVEEKRYGIASVMVGKEIETYIRYWDYTGIRFIFDQIGETSKRDFIKKWTTLTKRK